MLFLVKMLANSYISHFLVLKFWSCTSAFNFLNSMSSYCNELKETFFATLKTLQLTFLHEVKCWGGGSGKVNCVTFKIFLTRLSL